MTWQQDNSIEQESTGVATTRTVTGLTTSGVGASNDDYLFVVGVSMVATSGQQQKVTSCVLSVGGSGGGALTEMLRVRQDYTGPFDQIVQLFAIRNSDIASQLDIESAVTLQCACTLAVGTSTDMHFAVYVLASSALPTTGNLVDLMVGGVCQQDNATSGDLDIVNPYEALTNVGITHRGHAQSTSFIAHSPNTYNIFDSDFDTHSRVSGIHTSVIKMGIAPAANQATTRDTTGDNTALTLYHVSFYETARIGAFTPFFDADNVTTATCQADLAGAGPSQRRHKGRKLYTIFLP